MTTHNVAFAFLLTLLAGLSTGIGSTLALMSRRTNTRFLSLALGFSAGVMIYVSFIEIFPEARTHLCEEFGKKSGYIATTLSFFCGIALMALIDRLVPNFENPHEAHRIEEMHMVRKSNDRLMRLGFFSAIAISIHNLPEGMATFASALTNPALGISIAIAIAIHNIPEGIAISVPVFFATGDKKRAFALSFLSGLAEPVGALIGYLLLMPFLNHATFGIVLAATAGIMVFISLDELLPAAEEYGEHHLSIIGLIAGMLVMAGSLLLFAR